MRIYFDATTFDKITKDRAAKFVDKFSAIGGTMGLLTGFSIISGVEILYFFVQFILQSVKKLFQRKSFDKIYFSNHRIYMPPKHYKVWLSMSHCWHYCLMFKWNKKHFGEDFLPHHIYHMSCQYVCLSYAESDFWKFVLLL